MAQYLFSITGKKGGGGSSGNSYGDLLNTSLALNNNEVPLIFLMGQSNADGRASLAGIPDANVDFGESAQIWNRPLTRNSTSVDTNRGIDRTGEWKKFIVGDMLVGSDTSGASTTDFGVEVPIAMRWRDQFFDSTNKPLHIIKCAIGDSPLALGGGIDNDWSNSRSSIRNLAINYFAIPAIRNLLARGLTPVCLGFIWIQGESDAQDTAAAAAYATNLRAFIEDMRIKLGFGDIKFIIPQLSNFENTTNWQAIKDAQAAVVSATDNSELIQTDGSDGLNRIGNYATDGIHFSADGIMDLGDRIFNHLEFAGKKYTASNYRVAINMPADLEFNKAKYTDSNAWGHFAPAFKTPIGGNATKVLTQVRSFSETSRPARNSLPHPQLLFNDLLDNSDNVEIVFRGIFNGGDICRIFFMCRSKFDPNGIELNYGFGAGFRDNGSKVSILSLTGGSALARATGHPGSNNFWWYRIIIEDNIQHIDSSADGENWNRELSGSHPSPSGDYSLVLLSAFTKDRGTGIATANFGISHIYIRAYD